MAGPDIVVEVLTSVRLLALLALPIPCSEMLGDVFRWFRSVVLGGVVIPPYHITYVDSGAYVTHNTINSILWICAVGLVVGCRFYIVFFTQLSQVSVGSARHELRGLSRRHAFGVVAVVHMRYALWLLFRRRTCEVGGARGSIYGDSVVNAIFIDRDCVRAHSEDTERAGRAWKELVVCCV